jgi:hypothetical protein
MYRFVEQRRSLAVREQKALLRWLDHDLTICRQPSNTDFRAVDGRTQTLLVALDADSHSFHLCIHSRKVGLPRSSYGTV